MSELHYESILAEVRAVREDLIEKLDRLEERIKSEMAFKHQAIDFKQKEHERRLSFTEKVLFTTMGVILLGFLGALISVVIR